MAAINKLQKEIELRLGGGMIDVELDPEHYELAAQKALEKYRQRAENAVEESFIILESIMVIFTELEKHYQIYLGL